MNSEGKWPQAIFFDVGETLLRPRRPYGDLLTEVSRDLGVDLPAALADGLAARIDTRVAARTQQMLPFTFPAAESQRFWYETYHDFFLDFLSGANAHRLAQGLLQLLSSPVGYALFEDTVATLKYLRDRGYQLGIISNWEAWLPTLLQGVGIAQLFDHTIISGVCGLEKPDSRIFTLAIEQGGYRPGEVVYIGDRPKHDVGPAQEVGMIPILLDRTDRYRDDGACRRIQSLSELPLMLHGIWPESV